jgi:hypothetical protein
MCKTQSNAAEQHSLLITRSHYTFSSTQQVHPHRHSKFLHDRHRQAKHHKQELYSNQCSSVHVKLQNTPQNHLKIYACISRASSLCSMPLLHPAESTLSCTIKLKSGKEHEAASMVLTLFHSSAEVQVKQRSIGDTNASSSACCWSRLWKALKAACFATRCIHTVIKLAYAREDSEAYIYSNFP